MNRAVIFANGRLPDPELVRTIFKPDDIYLAADGGTRHALALGIMPAVIIGDIDSLSEYVQPTLEMAGVEFLRYPRDKNETDLELALAYAVKSGFERIVIVGALGGRLDQLLGNLSLLTLPELAEIDVRFDDGEEEVFFVRAQATVEGSPGDTLSLIPWGGDVNGITAIGLKWPLQAEALLSYKTRGISNVMLETMASIIIQSGLLLVVHRRGSHA